MTTSGPAGNAAGRLAADPGTSLGIGEPAEDAPEDGAPRTASQADAEVWEATPEPVRQAVAKGASSARQRRAALAVAAGVLIVSYLAVRRWGKR